MNLSPGAQNIKVALISSGLGNTVRGFETSTARWFSALQEHSNLDVKLYCGGKYPGGQKLWNFPRNGLLTRPVKYLPVFSEQQRWEFTYGVEQFSFWSALNFELISWKPDVVWVKDVPLAHLLAISRVAFGLKYKIIFANGSKFKPGTYKDFDLIQQIQGSCYEQALDCGVPANKMVLLSNCFPATVPGAGRKQVRQGLAIDDRDWVVVCVAAWNSYHKRIDYLIKEVAAMRDPTVKLLLCGYPEVDTSELRVLGQQLLADRVKWLTVPEPQVSEILQAGDVFVLPSLQEGLGNAIIEAALAGLPVVVHPHEGAQYSIADDYWFVDLSQPGNLTSKLNELQQNPVPLERLQRLQAEVRQRFCPQTQVKEFENMVRQVCGHKADKEKVESADLVAR